MPSYRHVPLSQRLGLSFGETSYWQLSMPNAECFMYFVAHLNRLFGKGYTLYVEGRGLDTEVAALYRDQAAPAPEKVSPLDRNPATQRLHVAMGPGLGKRMNHLAACKTYAEMGEAMLVYKDSRVWMDGRRLGERMIKLSGELPEAEIRQFASGYLRASIEWVEE
jgi:hypothetical protein